MKRDEVHVHNTKAYIISKDHTHWLRYNVTGRLLACVRAHDDGEIFPEGEYVINCPSASQTLDAMRERNALRPDRRTGKYKGRTMHREKPDYNNKEK